METEGQASASGRLETGNGGTVRSVATPIAKPSPKRRVISRRLFVLGGFWSGLLLAVVGILGSPLDFIWPRKLTGFGGPVSVTKDRIPQSPDEDPARISEGRFWLVNLPEGTTPNGEVTPGGLLALWWKCPHLGCTVPWRPDFTFQNRKGWFRCPCHGSTYTKDGGILVAGPAPRPMDVFPMEVNDDLSIVVQTGPANVIPGSGENPSLSAPYQAGSATKKA